MVSEKTKRPEAFHEGTVRAQPTAAFGAAVLFSDPYEPLSSRHRAVQHRRGASKHAGICSTDRGGAGKAEGSARRHEFFESRVAA
jgi:hypothetical protein